MTDRGNDRQELTEKTAKIPVKARPLKPPEIPGCQKGNLLATTDEGEGNLTMPRIDSDQTCQIRWMIRRDMPSVIDIEHDSFEFPWTEDEFIRCLRQRDCIGMVAEKQDEVAGFMIYELHNNRIHILSFAVHPNFRRQGIGRAMVDKLVTKLAYQRRNRIALEVRETNLAAQLFFRKLGFRATGVLRSFYEDTPEDAFLMQFRAIPDATGDYDQDSPRMAG